jgi:two-component system sensor histidine kinase and response regulator WspE
MAGPGDACDPALMELFRAELDTHIPVLGEGLLALEKEGNQPKLLEALMRAAHSIKGAGRIVGVEPAVRVAHVMEDCLVAAQKGEVRLGTDAIDALLRGVDVLTRLARPADTPEDSGGKALEEVVQALAAVQKGGGPAPPPAAPPAAAPPAVAVVRPDNLDRAGSEQLRRELLRYREAGAARFRIDLAAVRDVDPAALAVLALFARLPGADGSAPGLEVTNAPPPIARLLRLTRLETGYALRAGPGG